MKKEILRIDIVTLFPKMFCGPLNESILKIAKKKGLVKITVHNLRKFTQDRHRVCDDKPFGGGPGMVMKPEPLFACVEALRKKSNNSQVILLSPQGKIFNHEKAKQLSLQQHLIVICGRYEGVDERVREYLIDEEVSLGDFITTGGELPALCLVDAVVRLVPEVVGNAESLVQESFQKGLLDYPHYTRPRVFRGYKVPEVLVSGDHQAVKEWREKQALETTKKKRPDLLNEATTYGAQ